MLTEQKHKLTKTKLPFDLFQAMSGGVSPAGLSGWTAAPQPPTQSDHNDQSSVTAAAACFPQPVRQSHL